MARKRRRPNPQITTELQTGNGYVAEEKEEEGSKDGTFRPQTPGT